MLTGAVLTLADENHSQGAQRIVSAAGEESSILGKSTGREAVQRKAFYR